MTSIYLLESTPKNEIKTSSSFPLFYGHRTDNCRDSHYALSEEEEGGTVSSYLYRGTVVTGIATSAHPSLLMHQ
jgi:hypothetical protein